MTERTIESNESSSLPELRDPVVAEFWEAMLADTGSDIGVIDQDGRFIFVSPRLSYWRPENVKAGLTVSELLPIDAANERMELLRKVAATGKPIVLHSLWRGVRTRTTFRRLPAGPGGIVRILVTCRGTVPADRDRTESPDIEHVYAKFVDHGRLAVLTPRELEILKLVAQGLTTLAIAKKLFRSRKTIEAHRLALGNKLGVRNRVELARIAMEAGLLNEDTVTTVGEGEETDEIAPTEAPAPDVASFGPTSNTAEARRSRRLTASE